MSDTLYLRCANCGYASTSRTDFEPVKVVSRPGPPEQELWCQRCRALETPTGREWREYKPDLPRPQKAL